MREIKFLGKTVGFMREDGMFIKTVIVQEHFFRKFWGFGFSVSLLRDLIRKYPKFKLIKVVAFGDVYTGWKADAMNDCKALPRKGERRVYTSTPTEVLSDKNTRYKDKQFDYQTIMKLEDFYELKKQKITSF